jgi:predicted neutral ceramidase superfamily lipid hydrolase
VKMKKFYVVGSWNEESSTQSFLCYPRKFSNAFFNTNHEVESVFSRVGKRSADRVRVDRW